MSQSVVHCPICGKESDSKFCPNCGIDLDAFRDDNLSPESENFSCEEKIESGLCPDCGVENNECSCSETGFENESLNTENDIIDNDFTHSDNDTPEESMEEYAEKIYKSKVRRNLIILVSICMITIIILFLNVCFKAEAKKEYMLSDIKFQVPESWLVSEFDEDGWSGYLCGYSEDEFQCTVGIRSYEMSPEDYNYIISSAEIGDKTYFDYLDNDAITIIRDDNSSYTKEIYFYYNGNTYNVAVIPHSSKSISQEEKEIASKNLSSIFDSIQPVNDKKSLK